MKQTYTYSFSVYLFSTLGLLAIPVALWALLDAPTSIISCLLLSVCIASLLGAILLLPRSLELTQGALRLHCLGFTKTFALSHYRLEEVPQAVFAGGMRVFGSGGYFGYTGFFRLPKLGIVRLYVASTDLPLLRLYDPAKQRSYLINVPTELLPAVRELAKAQANG